MYAWCGIHLVRDLRPIHDGDPAGQSWAEAMVNTLLLANSTAHTARAAGRATLTNVELATIRSRYAGRSPVAATRTSPAATPCTPKPARSCGATRDTAT